VIATGESHSLEEFTAAVFDRLDLDWRAHVVRDETLSRPTDLRRSCGDPVKANRTLGWTARHGMRDVVRMMVDAEMGGSISSFPSPCINNHVSTTLTHGKASTRMAVSTT